MKAWNIKRVITDLNTRFGAPMGRSNVGVRPHTFTSGKTGKIFKKNQVKIYTKRVVLNEGYDNGGAYWGIGKPLYVDFNSDLTFIEFYRG